MRTSSRNIRQARQVKQDRRWGTGKPSGKKKGQGPRQGWPFQEHDTVEPSRKGLGNPSA